MRKSLSGLLGSVVLMVWVASQARGGGQTQLAALQGAERFEAVKEQIVGTIGKITDHGAADAHAKIVSALSEIKAIREKVSKAKHVDDVIDEVTAGLEKIAKTYRSVADMKKELDQFRSTGKAVINDANGVTIKSAKEVEDRKASLVQERDQLMERLKTERDPDEKKKMEVSIKARESRIRSLQAEAMIWTKFETAQRKLMDKLGMNDKKIDLLLHTLGENAQVYEDAANAARLRRSAKAALQNLGSLSDLQSVSGDLVSSWGEVNSLVDEISKQDFDTDEKAAPASPEAMPSPEATPSPR